MLACLPKKIVNLLLLDNWNVAQLGYLWKNQRFRSCKKMMNKTDFQISQILVLKTQKTVKQLPRKKQDHVKRVRRWRTSYLYRVWSISGEKKMVETVWATIERRRGPASHNETHQEVKMICPRDSEKMGSETNSGIVSSSWKRNNIDHCFFFCLQWLPKTARRLLLHQ